MLLAPEPQLPPTTITRDATTQRVTVDARRRAAGAARAGGDARRSAATPALAEPHPTPTSTLTFQLGDVPPGAQWVRLTVDGVESLLVDRSAEPPTFDPTQSVAVPA